MKNGPWFWVHAAFCYGLHAFALALLVSSLSKARALYYRPTMLIIGGILCSLLGDILFSFRINPLEGFDSASSTMVVIGPLAAWVMFGHRMFDLVPIAHNHVAEKISAGIIVLNCENRIVDLNQAAARTIGPGAASAIGRPADQVLAWSDLLGRYGDGDSGREEIAAEEKGTRKYYDLSLSPITSDQGKILGRLILLHDISDLRYSKEALEAASRSKSAFLANTSHEIRTPLNAIMGFTDLVLGTELNAEQRAHLDIVKSSSETLLVILNDIVDAAKIEAGKITLEEVDFNIRCLVDGIMQSLSLQAEAKRLTLVHSVAPAVPLFLRGDPVRLKQVLLNLMDNALKFTEKGKISLSVDAAAAEPSRQEAGKVALLCCVRDTGIGIPPGKQSCIFQSFTQADSTITRKYGGAGLGLSISRELVRLMGGELTVESEEGRGSSFCFTAVLKSGREVPATVTPGETREAGKSSSILLAEDVAVSSKLIVHLLEERGLRVTAVGNGREAVEALEREKFDLVLMDDRMPGLDGCEATRIIRDRASSVLRHDVPVIALSANVLGSDRKRFREAGMNDCLPKPVRADDLAALVDRYVPGGSRDSSSIAAPGPETAGVQSSLLAAMRAEIMERYAGDEQLVDELLLLFGQEIQGIARSLGEAYAAGDRAGLELQAHSCKSAAGSVGFRTLADLAAAVEQAARTNDLPGAGTRLKLLEQEVRRFLNEAPAP